MTPLARKSLFLAAALLLPAAESHALQVIEAADGVTVAGKLSAREVTRIAVAGGRVAQLFGSDERLQIEKDEAQGQLFVRLAPPASAAPVNVFVVDDAGRTYTLVLVPTDIPADTVLIKPAGAARPAPRSQKSAQAYQKAIKSLIRQMANDGVPDGYEVRERNTAVPLWKEVRFVLEREYAGERLRGEAYTLVNASGSELVMTPQEFYRPGLLAAAPERTVLAPGQSTRVFLVHERGSRNE